MKGNFKGRVAIVLIGLCILLAACGAEAPAVSSPAAPPTVSGFFATGSLPATPLSTQPPTSTPALPAQDTPAGEAAAAATEATRNPVTPSSDNIGELVIYDESLNPDWSVDQSWGVKLDLMDHTHEETGTVVIAVTPTEDYGALFFAVKPDAQITYPITSVVGASVWLNGGDDVLTPEDLAVTVIGSNAYPYYAKDDQSVYLDDQTFFSESRLNYLGITHTVPRNTWAEATVWLDKLPYEPEFQYVTGVYIKNDQGFRQTYYVDRVVLLVLK